MAAHNKPNASPRPPPIRLFPSRMILHPRARVKGCGHDGPQIFPIEKSPPDPAGLGSGFVQPRLRLSANRSVNAPERSSAKPALENVSPVSGGNETAMLTTV